jgi:alkyldihydroxyacetonephosphate synthase
VRAEAGARLSEVERALGPRGLSLGPGANAVEGSTVGGLLAGGVGLDGGGAAPQFVDVTLVLSDGRVVHGEPRSTVAVDPARLVLGSEGMAGVIIEATLSASRAPADLAWEVFRPHSFDAGSALVREIAQRPYRPFVLRLLDPGAAGMAFAGFGEGHRPLLMVAMDSGAPGVEAERFELRELAKSFGARAIERELAEHWWNHRADESVWTEAVMSGERALGEGVVADAFTTTMAWRRLVRAYDDVRDALLEHCERVGCRLQWAGPSHAVLVFPFVVRAADDGDAAGLYLSAWDSATRAAVAAGAGPAGPIGLRSMGWVREMLGAEGLSAAAAVRGALDPRGIMNPGKVLPSQETP